MFLLMTIYPSLPILWAGFAAVPLVFCLSEAEELKGEKMLSKLEARAGRFEEIQKELADPEITRDQKRYKELMQENAVLAEIMTEYERLKKVKAEIEDARQLGIDVPAHLPSSFWHPH